jgi:hypothetical protein
LNENGRGVSHFLVPKQRRNGTEGFNPSPGIRIRVNEDGEGFTTLLALKFTLVVFELELNEE